MTMATADLDLLNEHQLRDLARQLLTRQTHHEQVLAETEAQITRKERLLSLKDTTIAQLKHEIAVLRRFQFGKKSEQVSGVQGSLLDEAVDADIAAIEEELNQLSGTPTLTEPRRQPKRAALPAQLPRLHIHHEPDSTTCACGCQMQRIGEDVSEKLDYIPGSPRWNAISGVNGHVVPVKR